MTECNRRNYAAALAGLGQNLAALDLLCQNEEVRRSLNASGTVCPSQRADYIAAQQRANETGQMVVLQPDPQPSPRRTSRRRARHASTAR
jgi:hypothetical protein